MDKQEPITKKEDSILKTEDKIVTAIFKIAFAFFFVVITLTIFSVIALLYVNGFIGASIILLKLFKIMIIFFVLGFFFNFVIKFARKDLEKRKKFKEKLKAEVLKELKNGKRK